MRARVRLSGFLNCAGNRLAWGHEASHLGHGNQALWWLREARRGAQPMDAFLTLVCGSRDFWFCAPLPFGGEGGAHRRFLQPGRAG